MRVLVVGGGGREHAIVWKIAQNKNCSRIFCAPGNGGISDIADCIDIAATDIASMVSFAKSNKIDLAVVAPDDPLAMGMVDAFEEQGLKAFGPKKHAAVIESSKVFSKNLMNKYGIPTPNCIVFSSYSDALNYVGKADFPLVIKADGLALGKGVIVANNYHESSDALDSIMNKRIFGDAGSKVIIETFISGKEVSVLAFTDGKTVKPMISAQDHKRAFDSDLGPNTGGMGAFAPSGSYTQNIENLVAEKVIHPTINAMLKENRAFRGVLYFGLMLTADGPYVLEYNARFGDPETQAVLPLLKSDLLEIFDAIIAQKLGEINIEWDNRSSVCVVLSSEGYPGQYTKGYEIFGIQDCVAEDGVNIFHSGTKKVDNKYYTNGGRVLGITAVDTCITKASAKAYRCIENINFEGMHFRKDIGNA